MKKLVAVTMLMVSMVAGLAWADDGKAVADDSKQLLADIEASLVCLQKEGMTAYVKKWIPKDQQEAFLKSYNRTVSATNPEKKVLKSYEAMLETFKGGTFSFSENHGANYAKVTTKRYKPHSFIKDDGKWRMIQ